MGNHKMIEVLTSIGINIISSLITLLILSALGWCIFYFTRRSSLLSFFGIKETKRIILYLSRIGVSQSIGIDGVPRAFTGSAIAENEALLIPVFQRLFNFIVPGATNLPGPLKFLLISDVIVAPILSPIKSGGLEKDSTFIAVGSPGYNVASLEIENSYHPFAKFVDDNSAFEIKDVPKITDTRCAFVQKAVNQTTNQHVYYVAGMSSLGTNGAAFFLANNWHYLNKKYGANRPFCVVIRVRSDDGYKHEILFEKG